ELEWEYSCRGGATSPEECAFDFYFSQPTNDLSSEQANFYDDSAAGHTPEGQYAGRTMKVGSYQPNRLGLYEMHGNVWERCADRFASRGSARVYRGGSWGSLAAGCRASFRGSLEPAYQSSGGGFRLVAVPSGE